MDIDLQEFVPERFLGQLDPETESSLSSAIDQKCSLFQQMGGDHVDVQRAARFVLSQWVDGLRYSEYCDFIKSLGKGPFPLRALRGRVDASFAYASRVLTSQPLVYFDLWEDLRVRGITVGTKLRRKPSKAQIARSNPAGQTRLSINNPDIFYKGTVVVRSITPDCGLYVNNYQKGGKLVQSGGRYISLDFDVVK